MRKLVYYVGSTIDGYIAGPNGEHDWIVMDPEIDFAGMMNQFDTFLIGRKTFDVMKGMGNAGKSSKGITNIVFSRTLKTADWANTTIAAGDTTEEVDKIRHGGDGYILVWGGVRLFRSLMQLDLIDELRVSMFPYVAGEGTRLFDGVRRGVLIAESVWPNAAYRDRRGINTLTGADPIAPLGGAAFHDTRVRIRRAASNGS